MSGYPRPEGPGGYFQKPSNGTVILVLGILSLVICGFLGPVAWVMGNQSLKEVKAGIMDPKDEGLIQAGRIIGMVVTILICLGLLFYCAVFGGLFALGAAGAAGGAR